MCHFISSLMESQVISHVNLCFIHGPAKATAVLESLLRVLWNLDSVLKSSLVQSFTLFWVQPVHDWSFYFCEIIKTATRPI